MVDVIFTCPKLSATWHQLDGTILTSNYSWTGTIEQSVWDQVGNGTVTIIFYANNTVGKEASNSVIVRKDIIAPMITIHSPKNNSRHNSTAPAYMISIIEANLDSYYYIISREDDESIRLRSNLPGSIDQTLWNILPAGTYTLTVYANDTLGNLGSISVTIVKESLTVPPEISLGSFYLIIGIVSIVFLLVSVKHRLKKKF